MAMITAGTFLMHKATGSAEFTKVCDIISYPDMGSTPSKIDTTDLSCTKMKTSILGLQEAPDLAFEANYTKEVFASLKALEGKTIEWKLNFGDNGVDGSFTWSGEIVAFATGGGVDEVRKISMTISAETEITVATA